MGRSGKVVQMADFYYSNQIKSQHNGNPYDLHHVFGWILVY